MGDINENENEKNGGRFRIKKKGGGILMKKNMGRMEVGLGLRRGGEY